MTRRFIDMLRQIDPAEADRLMDAVTKATDTKVDAILAGTLDPIEKPKRKPKGKSPNARTTEECAKRGWPCGVVEQRIPHCFVTRDLFNFADVIAIDGKPGSLLIQATTQSNAAARVAKILAEPRSRAWIAAGNRISVWGWAKRGAQGKRKLWSVSEREITASDAREDALLVAPPIDGDKNPEKLSPTDAEVPA